MMYTASVAMVAPDAKTLQNSCSPGCTNRVEQERKEKMEAKEKMEVKEKMEAMEAIWSQSFSEFVGSK